MKTQARPLVLPIVLVLNAVGITAFWINWFVSGQHLGAEPEYFRLFENTFPLPDGILALLMLVLAWCMRRGQAYAPALACWVSGMTLYLFGLDTLYNSVYGAFRGGELGVDAIGPIVGVDAIGPIVIAVDTFVVGVALLIWGVSRSKTKAFLGLRARVPVLAALLAGYAVVQVLAWSIFATAASPDTSSSWGVFLSAFQLADLITALSATAAAAGLWAYRPWGSLLGLHAASGAMFGMLNLAGFMVMNPDLTGVSAVSGALICLTVMALLGVLSWVLLRLPVSLVASAD